MRAHDDFDLGNHIVTVKRDEINPNTIEIPNFAGEFQRPIIALAQNATIGEIGKHVTYVA